MTGVELALLAEVERLKEALQWAKWDAMGDDL
jgi:hypothetical protein